MTTPTTQPLTAALARASVKPRGDELTKQVQTWVATTFFGTLLKQMRNSPFRSELFDGGRGGQAFGALYDQQLAARMARSSGEKIVRPIVRRLEGKAAYEKQSALEPSSLRRLDRTDTDSRPNRDSRHSGPGKRG